MVANDISGASVMVEHQQSNSGKCMRNGGKYIIGE